MRTFSDMNDVKHVLLLVRAFTDGWVGWWVGCACVCVCVCVWICACALAFCMLLAEQLVL